MKSISSDILQRLQNSFEGELLHDSSSVLQYATDASVYREKPLLVARPKNSSDIQKLVLFARENNFSLTPRAAGTSLAGQVVSAGIIADVSRHMTKILEINPEEKWVRVEPGVVLDELNIALAPYGLFFGPETSTSNRCMIGGMLGNNACGAHSLIYGSTRDHTISAKAILSDGSDVEFGPLSIEEFTKKCELSSLEGRIYSHINKVLSDPMVQESIREEYPDQEIKRRNTGYAIDLLLETAPFKPGREDFNFCKLLAGSEGTLAFTYEIKLNLVPLPPAEKAVLAIHCTRLEDAFKANLIALKYNPGAVELMDDNILRLTRDNHTQQKNRFFLKGDPAALLIVEFARDSRQEVLSLAERLEKEMREEGFGYHFPLIFGKDISKLWALRKAGLGVLSNMPGDAKPVAVIEDTAVRPQDLPAYMADFSELINKYSLECVYYAHIGSGELHLRPVLNLKDKKDVELFRTIAGETAKLVKKYRGSLSGEHGDGRLRGAFIASMVGEKNYSILKEIKNCWDPEHIFNPGKIIDTPEMNTSLRYESGKKTRDILTHFDFSKDKGILRAAEKCNGSGDCRKSELIGGTMCPSYMATREEQNSTRARANILREFLSSTDKKNPFNNKEIYEVMDLCLSCKACKSECPSGVDITKYKAEFLQHYYDANGIPLRTRLIANIGKMNQYGSFAPGLYNFFSSNNFISGMLKKALGFAKERSIPLLHDTTLVGWEKSRQKAEGRSVRPEARIPMTGTRKVYMFADEFTNYNDTDIGIKAISLLRSLGYEVEIPEHNVSGRTYLSKGMVKKAAKLARSNVEHLHSIITKETPLIGIEPSAILCFRDEYPELVGEDLKAKALDLSGNCWSIEEFIAEEHKNGRISSDSFTKKQQRIIVHGHCYQKALASVTPVIEMLELPVNYQVEEIKSGCCGMAGSFGYEKEHYELSMKVGEMTLFPAVRKSEKDVIVVASGTSCRQQIKDGTGRVALHPVEVLYESLLKPGS